MTYPFPPIDTGLIIFNGMETPGIVEDDTSPDGVQRVYVFPVGAGPDFFSPLVGYKTYRTDRTNRTGKG
jgi:hypothetical protein